MTPQEAEKIIERAFGAAEVEKLDERIAAAEVAAAERDQDQDTGRSRKDMIPEAVQERGFLLGPMGLIAIAGIALAVAVGAWKLQYA
ncbi:hypothetical protein LTR02_011038 [Friedmanniomyces endolithicus]|nr:hypothetical protein LTR94_020997 [Friedmanniomyces endolithicus]KAK0784178.1 hypothetical protein LTR38_012751 [Friedmanniomyces endolithicus]KAK0798547.1 hypothetical protein LTR75_009468 [Friedmanniomyces endolithicus]KAK0807707.1 hypothetical protein LTR59_003143 [Friedmanniomyces endolithicus]KAK0843541.1 hypothetical protein LTR03_008639 [Friedmanniomyces endolithicus]